METNQTIYLSRSLCLPPSIHSHYSASLTFIHFQPADVSLGLAEEPGFLKLSFIELKVLTDIQMYVCRVSAKACSLTSSSFLHFCLHSTTPYCLLVLCFFFQERAIRFSTRSSFKAASSKGVERHFFFLVLCSCLYSSPNCFALPGECI